jgi:hypothetical protein
MNRNNVLNEYEIWTPRLPLEITLSLAPDELEMAMATNGSSLSEAVMRAIILALVVNDGAELH